MEQWTSRTRRGGAATKAGGGWWIALLAVGALASSAGASTLRCVDGGTPATPLDWSDPATWSPAAVPDAESDVLLAASCHVRCRGGDTCTAHTVRGTHGGASLRVGIGATLLLTGCEDADAADPAAYECGGEAGFTFAAQGAVVYDSSRQADALVRGTALDAPGRMRLVLAAPIAAAPGDWLQIRSGRARNQVYRVAAVDESGCPDAAHCYLDVLLHDPEMEFGKSDATRGYATSIASLAAPAGARIPAASANARCVELCSARSGDDCTDASVLSRDHSYVGWTFAAGSADPADPASAADAGLVVASFDDVPESVGPGRGVVDRVCFAEPLPARWTAPRAHRDLAAAIWPGWRPGDDVVLFRPATVRSTGPQRDAGLGFHGACVDADFAYFDGWAKLSNRGGTPECQRPYENTVIVADARGLPPHRFDQQAGCNGHSLDVWQFPAFGGDGVALVDTRAPVDAGATCLRDIGPNDGDPASSTHGIALSGTRFDPTAPPSRWLVRHAADDGFVASLAGLGPGTWTLRDWVFWYDMQGSSTEVVDFLATEPGQVLRIEDATVVMWSAGPAAGCQAAINDPHAHVRFDVSGLLYLDPRFPGPVLGFGDTAGHGAADVVAFGSAAGGCAAVYAGRVENAWIEGWSALVAFESRGVVGTRFAPSADAAVIGAAFGTPAGAASVEMRDFVATGLPAAPLVGAVCPSGCGLAMRDGFASWRAPYATGVSNFYPSANVALVAPLEKLLLENAGLLGCTTGWGESGAAIGRSLLVRPPAGIAIAGLGACPLAATQTSVTTTGSATTTPFRADLFGGHFGPKGHVGLSSASRLLAKSGLAGPFAIAAEICGNGVDDDWDGYADAADPGCADADDGERRAGAPCDDGLDEDGDGAADAGFDPGCPSPFHATESPACDDGADNDGDGATDGGDPDCTGLFVSSEGHGCGLGFEGAFAAAVILARRRRIKR